MPVLATTLRSLLAQADAQLDASRIRAAQDAFQDLLDRSQARADRGMQVVARSMLARCMLRRRDVGAALDQLEQASRLLDPEHLEAHGRYRGSRARVVLEDGPPGEAREVLLDYLRWAEEAGAWEAAVDASLLLAVLDRGPDRVHWLERGIEHGLNHDVTRPLGRAYNDLGAALAGLEQHEEALVAYERGLEWHRRHGTHRQVVGACWTVGASAIRTEDWPLARACLEEAVGGAEIADDCTDLLALTLADLARVYEAAGDVIEARRLVLRAAGLAREQDLPRFSPERWQALVAYGRTLELEL